MTVVTINDMIREVSREIKRRETVYPKAVEAGKMKQAEADRGVRVMEQTLTVLGVVQTLKDHAP